MKRSTRSALLCLVLSAAAPLAQAQDTSTATPAKPQGNKVNPDTQPVVQAKAFIATLNDQQREKAMLPFDSDQRVGWHFVPMVTRKGLPLMEMQAEQQAAAVKLLNSCLSPIGFQKARKIMELEGLLKTIEGDKGQNERNPVKYYFTIFGQPELKQKWGISIEGHHLSLNFVFNGNRVIDSTPQFFASNPAVVKESYDGFEKGLAVLKPEEQLAFELYKSLDSDQQKKAALSGETPSEIRAAGVAQPPQDAAQGIAVADLNDSQKESLKKLLTTYTNKMKQGVAKGRWEMIEEAGWDKVKFGWSGAARQGQKHYYVVQGPTFLVEFINVQPDAAGNPANHIHCVWRDMTGDFDLPAK